MDLKTSEVLEWLTGPHVTWSSYFFKLPLAHYATI